MVSRIIAIVMLSALPVMAADNDIAIVRERFIRSILPTDMTGQQELIAKAKAQADALRADGTWPDIDYAHQQRTQWQPQQHLDRILLMSKARRLKEDATLLPKIYSALDHWLERDYQNPNWWHNEIGCPNMIGQAIIMLQPDVTPTQLEKAGVIMRRSQWKGWTGQNLVWGCSIQILRGVIENDADAIAQAYGGMYDEVRITMKEGIQPDFSFHQHGPQFYSGGYGLAFAQDVPRYVGFAWGTRWQMPDDKLAILTSFLLDGEQWMMHGRRFDHSAVGRQIVRRGESAVPRSWTSGPIAPVGAGYGLLNSVTLLSQQPVPRRDELQQFAARMRDSEIETLIGNRHFWRSDYMAHHRPGWFASVRMFSTRLVNAELVNDEGKKSHHLADGCNFLYLDGNEYADIFPAWDWTKVPGTTAEATLDVEPKSIRVFGNTSFVGGVSDGQFGLAAMHLARGKLAARKAWFFFDKGYLCFGSGITCTSEIPVATTINQCLLRGEVERGDGWIRHNNVGYIVPRRGVKLTTDEQQGNYTDIGAGPDRVVKQNVFELWIDHGAKPTDTSYEYIVLPGAAPKHLMAPPVRVVSNTTALQAAVHDLSGTIACVFAEAGEVDVNEKIIAVDQPCLLLLRGDKVTLANPNNAPLTVNVRVNDRKVRVELPDGDAAGSSRTVSLSN